MSAKKRSPLHQWEAYYDYQWRLTLNPLYDKFQGCKAGEISHAEIDEAIHKAHKSCQDVYNLFTTKRDLLVRIIQINEEWFSQWVKNHPQPVEQ
jgi:hypothetical protein